MMSCSPMLCELTAHPVERKTSFTLAPPRPKGAVDIQCPIPAFTSRDPLARDRSRQYGGDHGATIDTPHALMLFYLPVRLH